MLEIASVARVVVAVALVVVIAVVVVVAKVVIAMQLQGIAMCFTSNASRGGIVSRTSRAGSDVTPSGASGAVSMKSHIQH